MALIEEYKQGLKKAQDNLKKALKSKDKKVNIPFLKHRIKEFKKQIKSEEMAKHTDTKSHNINVRIGNTNNETKVLEDLNADNNKEISRVVAKLNNLEFDIVLIQGYIKNKKSVLRPQFLVLLKNRKLQYNSLKKYLNTLVKFR